MVPSSIKIFHILAYTETLNRWYHNPKGYTLNTKAHSWIWSSLTYIHLTSLQPVSLRPNLILS